MDEEQAFIFVADELARCLTCGQAHEFRVAPGQNLRPGMQPALTWEHPADGHAYQTKYGPGVITYLRQRATEARTT